MSDVMSDVVGDVAPHPCDRHCRYYRKYSFYTGFCGRYEDTGSCKVVTHVAPDGREERTISPPKACVFYERRGGKKK